MEWWYYTGHLKTSSGEEYGFELTFFKVEWSKYQSQAPKDWKAKPLYIAHYAISDKNAKRFDYSELINRPIGGIAGADTNRYSVWNEDWSVRLKDSVHHLKAQMKDFTIDLKLKPQKKPVIHGLNGLSYKGKDKGNYSHYYSLTRLETKGTITIRGKTFQCTGLSWMDHEWMNNRSFSEGKNRPRWDWFSIQLSDHTEIMFYTLRDKTNRVKSASSGTIVWANQRTRHLLLKDVQIKVLDKWKSPKSYGTYPIQWQFNVPSLGINLKITPSFKSQELNTQLTSRVTYWEGAVNVVGQTAGKKVTGQGYVEMTGYAKKRAGR